MSQVILPETRVDRTDTIHQESKSHFHHIIDRPPGPNGGAAGPSGTEVDRFLLEAESVTPEQGDRLRLRILCRVIMGKIVEEFAVDHPEPGGRIGDAALADMGKEDGQHLDPQKTDQRADIGALSCESRADDQIRIPFGHGGNQFGNLSRRMLAVTVNPDDVTIAPVIGKTETGLDCPPDTQVAGNIEDRHMPSLGQNGRRISGAIVDDDYIDTGDIPRQFIEEIAYGSFFVKSRDDDYLSGHLLTGNRPWDLYGPFRISIT